jgi:tetratricopeptide (TPR) repeat protein
MADLEEAIQVSRQVVDTALKDHLEWARRLNSLGCGLSNRYLRTGVIADLEEAIQVSRRAVDITPEYYPDREQLLNNLGNQLSNQYSRTGSIADLENTIQVTRQAVDTTPEDYPDRARLLNNLGAGLCHQHLRIEAMDDLEEAVLLYQISLRQLDAATLDRIFAGREVLRLHELTLNWEKAYEDSAISVSLIPKLSLRSLGNPDRQYMLSQVVGLAYDATAAAFHAGKTPQFALSLLEQGHGVLAASLEEVRTDVLDLQERQPELARPSKS